MSGDLVLMQKSGRIIRSDFMISKCPVSVGDFQEIVDGKTASLEEKGRVLQTTWAEAVRYCNLLSLKAGIHAAYEEVSGRLIDEDGGSAEDISKVKGFRFPTPEEWEFAAKATRPDGRFDDLKDTLDRLWWGEAFYGLKHPEEIELLAANSMGIRGMIGCVYEWCSDLDPSEEIKNKMCGWTYYYHNYDLISYMMEKRMVGEKETHCFRIALSGNPAR